MMLKLVLFTLLTGIFVLLVCNKAIKLINNYLLKRNYKLSEKFSYFVVTIMAMLISVFMGRCIIYYLM